MAAKNPDLDWKQTLKDIYRPNRYALDDRFLLRDGQTHPFAVICPGGGNVVVCSFLEGTPIARKLNERGISPFIVYYRVRGKARFPQPQDDLARAVKEILSCAGEYPPHGFRAGERGRARPLRALPGRRAWRRTRHGHGGRGLDRPRAGFLA